MCDFATEVKGFILAERLAYETVLRNLPRERRTLSTAERS